jgi:hypothetical protein
MPSTISSHVNLQSLVTVLINVTVTNATAAGEYELRLIPATTMQSTDVEMPKYRCLPALNPAPLTPPPPTPPPLLHYVDTYICFVMSHLALKSGTMLDYL